MNQLDAIDRLPFELQARLEADSFFADVPVIVAEEGNIELEMARKQAVVTQKGGKLGVAVIVLQVVADDLYDNVVFGPMVLRPALQVVENLELNRGPNGTGKSARRIARMIRDVIKPLALDGITTEFQPDKPCIEPVDLKDLGEMLRAYQVNFLVYEAEAQGEQASRPDVIAIAGGSEPQFGLMCITEGAEVWYSLDDSFPAPGRAGSAVYSAAVSIPDGGLTVRAAAYKEGMVASQVIRARVEVS